MSWTKASELGLSRATLYRRLADDSIPSYTDPATGEPMLWVGSEPAPGWLAQLTQVLEDQARELADLRQAVEALRESQSRETRVSVAPAPDLPMNRPVSLTPGGGSGAPAPAPATPAKRRSPASAITPERAERLLALAERVLAAGWHDKPLSRALAGHDNWLWRVRRGELRSARAAATWERAEAWLASWEAGQREAA